MYDRLQLNNLTKGISYIKITDNISEITDDITDIMISRLKLINQLIFHTDL